MAEDTILQEIRAFRDEFARTHGYDVHAMFETLRELDRRDNRPVVRLEPRRPDQPPDLPVVFPQPTLPPQVS